ncbi:MAG: hypothetical protein PUB10_04100 [Clostridiales bacterium]|nr:hypothetical protein [Clostridiales bacterium]
MQKNKIFCNECKRAFTSKGMLAALLTGGGLAVLQMATSGMERAKMLQVKGQTSLISLYDCWLGGNPFGVFTAIFYMIVPILAVMPYGGPYFMDKKTGYMQGICLRSSHKKYLQAKFCSVFLTAGTAVCLPLILNLILNAMILPAVRPELTACKSTIQGIDLGGAFYYGHPMLYTCVYLVLDFIFAGLWGTLSLAGAEFLDNHFIVQLFPFILYFTWNNLADFLGRIDWMTCYIFFPNSMHSLSAYLSMLGLLGGLEGIWFLWLRKNPDLI